jgi:hypothetical protein
MVKLGNINTIIDDIMLILRNHSISESDSVSRIQIEQWIHHYRAMLIKQDIDRGRDINQSYVQSIDGMELDIVAYGGDEIESSTPMLVTKDKLPTTIDFHYKSGISMISDLMGNEIQLMTEKRSHMQKYRKYTYYNYSAYLKGNRIYINGPGDISSINVSGIFENPTEVPGYNPMTDQYPVPFNMVPVIKELIFTKEFKLNVPTDKTNDSNDDTQNAQTK